MPEKAKVGVPYLEELVEPRISDLARQAIASDAGLALFTGHFRSGKSTMAWALARTMEREGHPVIFLAESETSLRDIGIELPANWNIVDVGTSTRNWQAVLKDIGEGSSPVVVSESLDQFNATALFEASRRLRILTTLETPLVGADVFYALTQLDIESASAVAAMTCLWSQLLLPRLCRHCREPVVLSRKEAQEIAPGSRGSLDLWREAGCPECSQRGTRGWTPVFEVLLIDATTREAVTRAVDRNEAAALDTSHHVTMQEYAREALASGLLGVETYRREIARNPVLRATNQLERERDVARRTRELFRRFVDDAVIESVVYSQDVGAALGGRRADASCLFCDIRGFTSFSEEHEPQQVFRILNRIVDEVIALVIHHGGMVDKLIGDSVMALFGLPVEQPDHARSAAACALAIQRRITQVTAEHPDLASLKVGIGINSGELAVGCLGNAQRMDYTVLGDVVNTAARLESVAAPGQILIGPSTRHRLGHAYKVRDLGEMALKGKSGTVRVHELLCVSGAQA